jgi:hypothetical protein
MTVHVALGYSWYPAAAAYHFERALRELGCTVSYVGLPAPQRPGYSGSGSLVDVLAALPTRPDLYLWIPAGIEQLSIPTACYLIDVHLGHWREQVARFFDTVFVAQKDYLPRFRAATGHEQVYWLPLAAATDVHYDHKLERTLEIGFVGNLARAHQQTARARRLKLLAERFQTNDLYRTYSPAEVGEVYSRAKIVFNTSIAGDVTMRLFEGTACGALVLTDAVRNGSDELFIPGQELAIYQTDEDLLEKAAYFLAHAQERETIATAGQQRTLGGHTYVHRAEQILQTVQSAKPGTAALRHVEPAAASQARQTIYTHLHMLDALFDEMRAQGYGPLRRAWYSLPCIARRVLI